VDENENLDFPRAHLSCSLGHMVHDLRFFKYIGKCRFSFGCAFFWENVCRGFFFVV